MASVPENTALDFIVQNLTKQQLDYIEACPYTDGPRSLIECIEEAVLEYHKDNMILPLAASQQEMNMKKRDKPVSITKRVSAYADLNKFCTFSMGQAESAGHYIEVTEWSNHEGVDVCIHDVTGERNFSMTYGQFDALKACVKQIDLQ